MSDYSSFQAEVDSPGLFVNDNLHGDDGFFDFNTASEDHTYQDQDFSPVAEERHLGHLDDLSDDDGLYNETSSSANEIDDDERVREDEGVTKVDDVLSWKIEHSTGDHKLKGM
jgi:hypothetical protein